MVVNGVVQKKNLGNDDVAKILNNISKYFYLSNFTISISNKAGNNGKTIILYKVSGDKNGEKISINDNFSL